MRIAAWLLPGAVVTNARHVITSCFQYLRKACDKRYRRLLRHGCQALRDTISSAIRRYAAMSHNLGCRPLMWGHMQSSPAI